MFSTIIPCFFWSPRIIANYSHHPVYQYVYSYDGTFTTIDPFILPTWKYLIKLFAKVRLLNVNF